MQSELNSRKDASKQKFGEDIHITSRSLMIWILILQDTVIAGKVEVVRQIVLFLIELDILENINYNF